VSLSLKEMKYDATPKDRIIVILRECKNNCVNPKIKFI
jgi:hypothetical protein